MDYQPLKYIYKASGNPEAYTLLLLHGTGGNEHDLIPLAEDLGTQYNFLSVRGNVLEHGMPRFFKRLGMGVFDEQDLAFRTEELIAFLKEVAVKESFDPAKIIALGYSNGANIAGSLLVTKPDFLAGAILFRPMQPFKLLGNFVSNRNSPVFLSSGDQDPTVIPAATEGYTSALIDGGFDVSVVTIPAGHNLTRQDVQMAAEWLGKSF
ncbi:MAG: alpha/beta hydrolase [Bacteroidota bacterium]